MADELLSWIQGEIASEPIVLFAKGTKEVPRCGFSARTIAVFTEMGRPFKVVDVLPDPRIREVLSSHSNWPTIPQVFVGGQLVGGCDIVTEMHASGELAPLVEAAFEKK